MAPNDAASRAAAIDGERSFIVQAPAGSGKTTLLIQRLLVLLARVDAPEEIIAITFTRKAAAEMRVRLLAALRSGLDQHEPRDANEGLTRRLAAAALERDRLLGWSLLDNAGRLRIMTIDSLCAWLARQMPLASGLGRVPAMRDDASELYLEAARATLALLDDGLPEQAAAVAELLVHLDNNSQVACGLIATMLSSRDQWLRLVGGAHERQALEEVLAAVRREAHVRLEAMASGVPPAFWQLAAWSAEQLAAAGQEPTARLGLDGPPGVDEEEAWAALAELWLTKEGAWRKQVNKNQGFPAPTGIKDGGLKAELTQAKSAAKELLEQLAADPAYEPLRQALAGLRELPAPNYSDEQWRVLAAIVSVLKLAVAQLTLVFAARGEADYAQVARAALDALEADKGASDLAIALDARIRHLLVDEFQDTSLTQYRLLELLTQGWSTGDGRTLFLVGDPMQSIYRFREADVGLFLRARAEGLGQVRLEPLVLSSNFRSQAGIVDWVNQAFVQVMPAVEDITAGAVAYSPAQAARAAGVGPAVELHTLAKTGAANQIEAQAVVAAVAAAWSEDRGRSIAVLVRGRSHLAAIVPALREAGLPCAAVEIDALATRPVVQDLYALTRALLHPADRIAWLAVLRAPWCGLTLAELELLTRGSDAPLEQLMSEPERMSAFDPAARARLERLKAALLPLLARRRREPLHVLLERAWIALAGPACHARASDGADVEAWFDLVAGLEVAGHIDSTALLAQQLEKLFAAPEMGEANPVQLMTIHKSKGLEFDTVIVPGLERSPRAPEPRLLAWLERAGRGGHGELLLAPLRQAGSKEEPIHDYIARLQSVRETLEAGRLLYVAATRAQRKLHLVGAVRVGEDGEIKPPPGASLLGQLWSAVAALYEGVVAPADENAAAGAVIDQGLRRLPLDWQPDLPARLEVAAPAATAERFEVDFSWAGESVRHAGTVVHHWLQRIAGHFDAWTPERVQGLGPRFARQLAALGVPESERAGAVTRVTTALSSTLQDERGRWVLGADREAQSEWKLCGWLDGRRLDVAIDRSFVDESGLRWIVDYKTGWHEGAGVEAFLDQEVERYRPQLERYARLVAALEPGRQIRLALYFPLMKAWREWTPAAAVQEA